MTFSTRSMLGRPVLGTVVVIVSLVAASVLFYLRHHDSRPASSETAAAEFRELQARFADQKPLLDMRERRVPGHEVASGSPRPLHTFHTVVFDTRGEQRLVHITVPYWFARRFARHAGEFQWLGELTFLDDTEFDPDAIRLSLDEIEAHGPGLIVYHRHASGGQFMAWVD